MAGDWSLGYGEGTVAPEPGHGDGGEQAGSRETEVEASLLGDVVDGREGRQCQRA